MTDSNGHSVLVVGSGPVGLTLANLLAAQDIAVRILTKEAHQRPVEHSRAEGNHARTLAVYERLGVLAEALARGRFVHGAVLHKGDRRLARIDMDDPDSYYPALGLGQSWVERILEARLETAGVAVERGWELAAVSQTDARATATLTNVATNETNTITADYIVACDGGKGTSRNLVGATFEGDTSTVQYALADVKVTPHGAPYDDSMHVWFSPMMMLARLDGNYWRAVAPTDASQVLPDTPETVLSAVQTTFRQNGVAITIGQPRWTTMFRVNTRRVNKMRWGRIFLAGDAAHVHSPMGGQGMNEGIQDVLNLAWKLAAVLKHGATETLLDTYDAERQPIIEDLLAQTERMTRLMEISPSPLATLRTIGIVAISRLQALHPLIRQRFTGSTRTLQQSSLVSDPDADAFPRRGVRPGDRAPDALGIFTATAEGPRRLFTLWESSHRHELLIFVGDSENAARRGELSALAQQIEAQWGSQRLRARVVTRSGTATDNFYLDSLSHMHRRFGAKNECAYLIRPDGFIAHRAASVDPDTLLAFLRDKYGSYRQPS
jgi:2-polyprenyl-6-methoxyphenol hydroxylase-like FAD-dependent oxidoreductase